MSENIHDAANFGRELDGWASETESELIALFLAVVAAAHASITIGSAVTGALGQPVDTGFLLNSWTVVLEAVMVAVIASSAAYAQPIEDGVSRHGTPIRFKSAVGGAHSVATTEANIDKLIAHQTAKLRAEGER